MGLDSPRLLSDAGVVAPKTLESSFPERFKIRGVDREITALIETLSTAFKQYVP